MQARWSLYASAQQQDTVAAGGVEDALAVLERAAADGGAPPVAVFQALRTLEKAKLPVDGWPEVLGDSPGGKRWRLVFTSGTKQVQEAIKGLSPGGGRYFPLTAVQRWDAASGTIENGIFLGWLAALTFSGPYAFVGKKLSFDFDTLRIKVGPAPAINIPLKKKIEAYIPGPKDPFFLFFAVNENLVAARGRGGGVAFWARTTPKWDLENGVA